MARLCALSVILVSVFAFVRAKNPGDCDIYKDCVECKGFSTGAFGVMDCIHHCDIANYIPAADDHEFDVELKALPLCQYKTSENCWFFFRLGDETEYGPNLYLKQDLECMKYEPTQPPVPKMETTTSPSTTTTSVMKDKSADTDEEMQSDGKIIEDARPVAGVDLKSGSKESENDDINSSVALTVSVLTLTLCFLLALLKQL